MPLLSPTPATSRADHAVDPDELLAAARAVAAAAEQLRGFDTDQLTATAGQSGHEELSDALRASAIKQRTRIAGLIDELDAMTEQLRRTAHTSTEHDQEHARRLRATGNGEQW
jgi:hypothetical protein